jgi:hypothetical protein
LNRSSTTGAVVGLAGVLPVPTGVVVGVLVAGGAGVVGIVALVATELSGAVDAVSPPPHAVINAVVAIKVSSIIFWNMRFILRDGCSGSCNARATVSTLSPDAACPDHLSLCARANAAGAKTRKAT